MKKLIFFIAGMVFAIGANVYASSFPAFTDTNAFENWFSDSVFDLQEKEVVIGYPDGSFQPTNNINRAEMAVLLDRYDNYASTKLIAGELHSLVLAMNSVNKDEVDEKYLDEVIMAEARIKESKEMPDPTFIDEEIADAKLPDKYTAYHGAGSMNNGYIYLKYDGGRDIYFEGPLWYGPYFDIPYAYNNPGWANSYSN